MKHVILVSHGTLAQGLHDALSMLTGSKKEEILSTGLLDGMSIETFEKKFISLIKNFNTFDTLILLSDIIGGSPMTTALNVLNNSGFRNILAFGGMNLAMGMAAVLEDYSNTEFLRKIIISEARESAEEFRFELAEDEEI